MGGLAIAPQCCTQRSRLMPFNHSRAPRPQCAAEVAHRSPLLVSPSSPCCLLFEKQPTRPTRRQAPREPLGERSAPLASTWQGICAAGDQEDPFRPDLMQTVRSPRLFQMPTNLSRAFSPLKSSRTTNTRPPTSRTSRARQLLHNVYLAREPTASRSGAVVIKARNHV